MPDHHPTFFHISVNARRANSAAWGDTQYAEGLGRAIARLTGADWALLFRGEEPPPPAKNHILIRITGPHLEEPVPGMISLLWMISPPNLAPLPMLARYQGLFCASRALSAVYRNMGVPADFLPQSTEITHFHPDRRPPAAPEIPLLFVGGLAERAGRRLVFDAISAGFAPQIWGPGWQGKVPDHLWQGERLNYEALAATYARARVILNCHMPRMAQLGFMSNRSYDALASGALVVSDQVSGYAAPDLPELSQVEDAGGLAACLERLLSAPPLTAEARRELHQRIVTRHSFDHAAAVICERAAHLLRQSAGPARPLITAGSGAKQPPQLTDPAASASGTRAAVGSAATEILTLARYLADPLAGRPAPPLPSETGGVIHPLMADLREIQQIALLGDPLAQKARIDQIEAAARRVAEALTDRSSPLGFRSMPAHEDYLLARISGNKPLWAHSPEGFDRTSGKGSVRLWNKRDQAAPARPIGVFLHLFYDDLAPVFATRLQAIRAPLSLYVSTDTEEKAARIRQALPMARIRVMQNRGRDMLPKLYGFRDVYQQHDIVLHLHGKKSPHSDRLDDWLAHILDCLLGSVGEVNRILSFFETIPRLGIVSPIAFRTVLAAAHWGDNFDIARELASRLGLSAALPPDNELRFPVGSMFWGRTEAIRPLLDLALGPNHFPPEAGQVDGTLAHALERMLGVVAMTGGYHVLPVTGLASRQHARHQQRFSSNGDLRRALEQAETSASP